MKKNLEEAEQEIEQAKPLAFGQTVRIRRSWRTLVFPILLSLSIVAIAYLMSVTDEGLFVLFVPIVPLCVAVIVIRPILLKFDRLLEISPHHVRFSRGKFSLRQQKFEMPYEDLLGVTVERTLGERLLNLGTLELGTALRDKPEIVIDGIANPDHIAKLIHSGIDTARIRHRGRGAGPAV